MAEEEQVEAEAKEAQVEWRHSEARDVLYDMLLDQKIPKDMKPKQVYMTYLKDLPAFKPFQNYTALKFANKLSSARKRAGKKVDRAAEDEEFFQHDRVIFPAPTLDTKQQPIWKDSPAQKLLKVALADIATGKKEYLKPRFLYVENEEWHENFSLEFFRKKIYQEIKHQKRQAWLTEKYGDSTEKDRGSNENEEERS